jgi:hypothetical protein
MKRTSLTTAVIAGIAGVAGISNMASAIYLNNDGLGSVLVYPYYTVNANNSTAITVVNTTSLGKAVKVRFLEAYDSREVLDFNLYLSPFDVWAGQVVTVGAGAGVFSPDNSCTVPTLPSTAATAQPFLTYAFDGSTILGTDNGPTDVSRTLEGYVELIEMGTVTNATNGSLTAITHTSAGVPSNCAKIVGAWAVSPPGYWTNNAAIDIGNPSGGLFGSGTIVNVGLGVVAGYNADAIDQFYSVGTPGIHSPPTDLAPSIASATSKTSYVFQNGALATTTYAAAVDAVSSLFMADAVYNEYVTLAAIGASTEWVVTFPTKRFYVDPFYVTVAQPPFDTVFGASSSVPNTSCSPIGLAFYDREEKTSSQGTGFSPKPNAAGNALCYEAQVVTFNQATKPSKILGSHLTANIATGLGAGWAQINLATVTQHRLISGTANANVFYGLPVTGFSVQEYVNSAVSAGVLANYTALYRHKFHRNCNAGTAATACS